MPRQLRAELRSRRIRGSLVDRSLGTSGSLVERSLGIGLAFLGVDGFLGFMRAVASGCPELG